MATYKYISETAVARIDDDGISRDSCSVEDAGFLAWLAEGNTPLAADPPAVAPYVAQRQAAFRAESDPLFFQQQRGEVPPGTWEARVAEIRARIPQS